MRSIGRALTWEFWRQYRWSFLGIFSYTAFFLVWIRFTSSGILGGAWNDAEEAERVAEVHRILVYVALLGCSAVLASGFLDKSKRMGFSVRHYALPIRTSVLVAWQMVCMTIFVSLLVLAMAGCFRMLTGLSFPVFVPALFGSAVLVWMAAGLWVFAGSQVLSLLFFAAVLTMVLISGLARIFFKETWRSEMGTLGRAPLPILILLFAGSLLAAYQIAVAGAARDRRGDAFSLLPIREWLLERLGTLWVRQKRFSSPAAAQFWFEWRQKGFVMPIIAAAVHAGILVLILAGVISRTEDALQLVWGISYVFLSFAWFFVGLLFGSQGMYSGKWEPGAFPATRPMNNRDLSFAPLKAGAASIAVTFAVCLLAILPWVRGGFLEGLHLPGRVVALMYLQTLGHLCGVLLSGWTLMGLGACISLTGHKWVLGVLGAIFFVFFFGWITLQTSGLLSADTRKALFETLAIIIALGCFLGVWAAFRAAYRKRLIGKGLVSLSACLWLIPAASAVCIHVRDAWPYPVSLPLVLFLITLMALPVAPLALAPLALSWNRHR